MFTKLYSTAMAAALIAPLCAGSAHAGSATLTLTRNSLNNVSDAVGLTQYETGAITSSAGASIGFYNVTRRLTNTGGFASVLNAASETINLALATAATSPYQNLTVEGVHSFNTGEFAGSTSAASSAYKFAIGGDASLTVTGSGVTTLKLGLKGNHTIP